MFSSKAQLQKRTPEDGTDRKEFLSLLVNEFLNSDSYDAKCQVLANLANFAYDPINYGYLRDVGVLEIFLYVLKNESDEKLLHFASSGICNLCNDPLNASYILKQNGLKPIIALLKSFNSHIVANSITILIYMYSPQTKSDICSPDVLQVMQELVNSKDKKISNLATVFLQDVKTD